MTQAHERDEEQFIFPRLEKAGKLVEFNEVRAGGSYLSENDPRLHFGLGAEARMDEIEIKWPSGKVEVLHDVPADFIYTITESEGIQRAGLLVVFQNSFELNHGGMPWVENFRIWSGRNEFETWPN